MSSNFHARARRERSNADLIKASAPDDLPPHSEEAEQHVIACCLLDGADTIARSLEAGVSEKSFYFPRNSLLWRIILALYQKTDVGGPASSVTLEAVAEELKTSRQLEAVGGFPYLMQVTGKIPTTAHAGYFLEALRVKEQLREVDMAARGVIDGVYAYSGGGLDKFEPLIKAAEVIEKVRGRGGLLPAVADVAKFMEEKLEPLKELVSGLLRSRYRMLIAGGSKSFKTWILMDLSLSLATGTPFWGMRVIEGGGRVLYVNFELKAQDMQERLKSIAAAKKITLKPGQMDVWDMDGHAKSIDELLPVLEAVGSRGQYIAIILDPIYVCLGDRDENSNSDVTDLMNKLSWLARRTGAAVLIGHHFSKGNQSEKDAKDRASGAGAWVRAPDTVMTVTPLKDDDGYGVNFVLRGMKPREAMAVRWEHPCMRVAVDLDPGDLREAGRPKEKLARHTLAALAFGGMKYEAWLKSAGGSEHKISQSMFKRHRHELLDSKEIVQDAAGLYWRSGEFEKRNPKGLI